LEEEFDDKDDDDGDFKSSGIIRKTGNIEFAKDIITNYRLDSFFILPFFFR